jgi:hypothetical protein
MENRTLVCAWVAPDAGEREVKLALELAARHWGRHGGGEVEEVRPLSAVELLVMTQHVGDGSEAEEFREQLAAAVARSAMQLSYARFNHSMRVHAPSRAVFGWAVYARERELVVG